MGSRLLRPLATVTAGMFRFVPARSGIKPPINGERYTEIREDLAVLKTQHGNLSGKVDDLRMEILANRKLILKNGGS